jgi:hypothetical protein
MSLITTLLATSNQIDAQKSTFSQLSPRPHEFFPHRQRSSLAFDLFSQPHSPSLILVGYDETKHTPDSLLYAQARCVYQPDGHRHGCVTAAWNELRHGKAG